MGQASLPDFITVVISHEEILSGTPTECLSTLKRLIETPRIAKTYMERVDVAFDGFDENRWELWEIDPVREFVRRLDEQFPYWLFFLSKAHGGLKAIVYCFLPPFLTPEAQEEILPERMRALMDGRWFPAMNHVSEYAGLSEDDIHQLSNRVVRYFTDGPFFEAVT